MIKAGITGGIGSGKTTFCREWEKLGVFVLYADDFAKQLMQEDEELISKIKKVFGEEAYNKDGSLNREYLAKEAFEKGKIERLNNIVHPILWKRVDELAREKQAEGSTIFAIEAAIMLNKGRPKDFDYVILLLSDEDVRVKRVIARDKAIAEQVKARMNKQPDFDEKTNLTDFIVINNGTLDELKEKARGILNEIEKRAN